VGLHQCGCQPYDCSTFSATDIVVTAGPFVTVPLAASPNGTGYIGAAVDYTLGGADHDRVASVSVALYDAVSGGNKMVENTSKSAGRVNNEEQGPGYTSAFRVKIGTYTVSSTWNLGAWATTPTRTVVPARAVITVTDVDGWTYVVENTTFLNTPPSHVTWASLFPTLTYTAGANGTISGTTPQAILSYGANGTLVTAVADVGYHFVKWSDNNSTTAARTDTDVQGDITTTASFAINTYTLTVNKTGNGTVVSDPTPVAGKYDHGTVVTLTVTPDAGWHFESWTGATPVSGEPAKATVTMDADKAVTATFSLTDILVTAENFNTNKGTDYYGVATGYLLSGTDAGRVDSVTVKLYDASNALMVTNTSTMPSKVNTAKQYSSPSSSRLGRTSKAARGTSAHGRRHARSRPPRWSSPSLTSTGGRIPQRRSGYPPAHPAGRRGLVCSRP
jgi:hypothetical protein